MKNILIKASKLTMMLASIGLVVTSCVKQVNPDQQPEPPVPPSTLFGFETRSAVPLTIDYGVEGFQAIFQIFAENPVDKPGTMILKEGVAPIFKAYTDNNSKFEGRMYIPTAVKEVYLYTDRWGLSSCVKLSVSASGVQYSAATANNKANTRVSSSPSDIASWFKGNGPYDITSFGFKYSIDPERIYAGVKWTTNGEIKGVNSATDVLMTKDVNGQPIADISKRAQDYLGTLPMGAKRAELIIKDPKIANVTTKEDATKLSMVFLDERGEYPNSLGYYYYKTTNPIANTNATYFVEDFNNIKKYVVFPHVAMNPGPLSCGSTVALKFYGENGDQEGTYDFPKNYVIGFFMVPSGFVAGADQRMPQYALIDGIRPNDPRANKWGLMHSSNELKTAATDFRRFISLYDGKSKSIVIGIEDELGDKEPDGDYCDATFIVASDKDINGGQPEIPPVPEEPIEETFKGTLAFEDIWPHGGDYDMNDVVVEYNWTFTFDKNNNVTKLVEKYTPVHDGAAFINLFAYELPLGTVTTSAGMTIETGTNSVIINDFVENCLKKEFTVTRTFSTEVKRDMLIEQFNPYIIVEGNVNRDKGRKEVHLPKHLATDYADKSLINTKDDAYFMRKDGAFPFAINLPITGFKLVTEGEKIEIFYPKFKSWAESKGTKDADWYVVK